MKNRCFFRLFGLLLITLSCPIVFAAQTLINETVTVNNLGYRYWYVSLNTGDRLTGSIYGSSDINFYILDSNNFSHFSSGRSFYASYYKPQVSALPSFDFTTPSSGTWYIVLDNQYSLFTSKSVAVTIYLDSFSQSSVNSPDLSGLFILAGILLLIIVGAAAYSNAQRRNKKENVPLPPS